MSDLAVRIERLAPMRVAWVRAVGLRPEQEAWRLLSAWAQPIGLFDDPETHPVFGFNSPSPAGKGQEYGYELWIAIGSDTQPPNGIGVKEYPGGLFAVVSCPLGDGTETPQRWRDLLRWVQASPHAWRRTTHELERVQNPLAPTPEMVLDLCLPLEG